MPSLPFEEYSCVNSKSYLPYMSRDTYGDKRKPCFHNGNMSMASKLRAARKAARLTQAQVAKAFGISREAVALWESEGEKGTKPDIRKLHTLAELYNVEVIDLLDEPEKDQRPENDYLSKPMFSRSVQLEETKAPYSDSPDEKEVISIWNKMSASAKDRWMKIGGILLGDDAEAPPKPTGRKVHHPGHSEANSVMKGKMINDQKKEDKK